MEDLSAGSTHTLAFQFSIDAADKIFTYGHLFGYVTGGVVYISCDLRIETSGGKLWYE